LPSASAGTPITPSIPLAQKGEELKSKGVAKLRKAKDKPLPSQKQQTPSSQDEIIKELRDQEGDIAAKTAKPSKPRGDVITAPLSKGQEPPKETGVSAAQTFQSKDNAAKAKSRQAQIEAHMAKKGFTKVTVGETGEAQAQAVAPTKAKKTKAPKAVAQQILETPAGSGEMGKALSKAAAKKKIGKGTAAGIGLVGALSAVESAITAPKGQKVEAVKSDLLGQAKFAAGAGVATKVAPTIAPVALGALGTVASSAYTGFKLGEAAHAAKGIFTVRKEAAKEKAGSEAKYGTIEKATQTRKRLSEQAKRRKPLSIDQASRLMDRWK